jgi:predicted AAA+ superfamily ATPase
MERTGTNYLKQWLLSKNRNPLVIRGARQVGKTWLVRHFAKLCGRQLIELNFEKQPSYLSLFTSNDPNIILLQVGALFGKKIDPEKYLLFLDEIQAVPQLFSKLRWFAEDLPSLPVIAAGSLLEFVLQEHTFSMPVGRISYMYLEPLSFEEFLLAQDQYVLYEYLCKYDFSFEVPSAIHEQLMALFKEYLFIGGLPAVVANWASEHSLDLINQIQQDLLATYRNDFAKYSGRIAVTQLEELFVYIPKMLGQKFVFSRVNKQVQSSVMKKMLALLEKARVSHRVYGSAANGVPLAAEIKEKYFKEIFLDVGLCSGALGLNLNKINTINQFTIINNGGIAEQVVGQLLRTINPFYVEPILYCWNRETPGSSAEIDYIIQYGNTVIPIEVKAGSTGSLKSLHLFMKLKNFGVAIRINSDVPTKTNVEINFHSEGSIKYQLLSIPFYFIGRIYQLLDFAAN